MKNILDENCREHQNTYFMFDNFLPKIVQFKIMWKFALETDKPQMTT
jgi:hypothetical protein